MSQGESNKCYYVLFVKINIKTLTKIQTKICMCKKFTSLALQKNLSTDSIG